MLRMLVHRIFPERAHMHDGGTFNIREIVFGFNDGLVTTFTVVVGFTGAAIGSRVIVIAALLNAISDGLSMAFAAYLSTKSERETYEATILEERAAIDADPGYEARALRVHLRDYGIRGKRLEAAVRQAERNKDEWARLITRDVRGGVRSSVRRVLVRGVALHGRPAQALILESGPRDSHLGLLPRTRAHPGRVPLSASAPLSSRAGLQQRETL